MKTEKQNRLAKEKNKEKRHCIENWLSTLNNLMVVAPGNIFKYKLILACLSF